MNINKQLKAIKINVSLMYYTTNIWIFFRMFELKSPISVQVINGGINGGAQISIWLEKILKLNKRGEVFWHSRIKDLTIS